MSDAPKPHPISLEDLFFVRSIVIAVPAHNPTNKRIAVGPENSIGVVKLEGEGRRYEGKMRTVMNLAADPQYPYSVDMECFAHFTVDDTLSDEDANRGVYITAHNVMYGAIREAVSWISGRQPYGPLQLGLSVLTSAPSAGPPASNKTD